jgi:hypothetical protein
MSVEVLVTQSAFAGSIMLIEGPNNKKKANTTDITRTIALLLQKVSGIFFDAHYIE